MSFQGEQWQILFFFSQKNISEKENNRFFLSPLEMFILDYLDVRYFLDSCSLVVG